MNSKFTMLCLIGLVLMGQALAAPFQGKPPVVYLKTRVAAGGKYQVGLFVTPLSAADAQKACKAWFGGKLVTSVTLEVPGLGLVPAANRYFKGDIGQGFWTGGKVTGAGSVGLVGRVPLGPIYANQFYNKHAIPKGSPALCFALSSYAPAGVNNFLATECKTKLYYACEAICNAATSCN